MDATTEFRTTVDVALLSPGRVEPNKKDTVRSHFSGSRLYRLGTLSSVMVVWLALAAIAGKAQTATAPQAATNQKHQAAPGNPVRFEVVSIHPSRPGQDPTYCGMTPDGYQARNLSLAITVANAFEPRSLQLTNRIAGLPPWAHNTMYDIVAKVAPEDVPGWRSQGSKEQEMRLALQAMLADRFKLAAHAIPANVSGFSLVIGKRLPQLKEAKLDEPLPTGGVKFRDGGVHIGEHTDGRTIVRFFAVTMDSFAEWLTQSSIEHPVVNATGLTGKYDFSLVETGMGSSNSKGVVVSLDNNNPSNLWNIEALGLKLRAAQVPAETIVIDHLERPSEN